MIDGVRIVEDLNHYYNAMLRQCDGDNDEYIYDSNILV
jgi:hypothetical protein